MTKARTNAREKSSSKPRRRRMYWGEAKIKFSSMLTPYGHQLIGDKAAHLQISRSELIEYLCRSLDDPRIEEAVIKQMTV